MYLLAMSNTLTHSLTYGNFGQICTISKGKDSSFSKKLSLIPCKKVCEPYLYMLF